MSDYTNSGLPPLQRPSAELHSCSRSGLLEIIGIVEALAFEQRWTDLHEFLFDRSLPPFDGIVETNKDPRA